MGVCSLGILCAIGNMSILVMLRVVGLRASFKLYGNEEPYKIVKA